MPTLLKSLIPKKVDVPLWTIALLALALRLPGVLYGLPLTSSVTDEPSLILGALQMLHLHTIVPAMYPAQFNNILYYPPYLSYVFLVPFAGIIGVHYLLWGGTSALFATYAFSDLSPFFIAARLISIAFSIASTWFLYHAAEALLRSRRAALVAAFLFATSLLNVGLSMVARHWVPATFFFILVLYILTRERMPEGSRYFWALVIGGIGVGISTVLALTPVLLLWWWGTLGTLSFKQLAHDTRIHRGTALFAALCILPSLLHNRSNGAVFDYTGFLMPLKDFDIVGLITTPIHMLLLQVQSEPVLIGLCIAGVGLLVFTRQRLFYFLAGFFLSWAGIFFLLFNIQPRFMLPLVALYALAGGYAFDRFSRHTWALVLLCTLLCIPLAASVRLDILALGNDTRIFAREWLLNNAAQDKVIVAVPGMRISAQADAVAELRAIEPKAVRPADKIDEELSTVDPLYGMHALNLFTVDQAQFFNTLPTYAANHSYTYFVYSPELTQIKPAFKAPLNPGAVQGLEALAAQGTPIVSWEGMHQDYSIADSSFTGPLSELLSGKPLGPDIVIYKLR